MINYLRRLNDALPGLVLGILIYGVILEIPVLIFAPDRLGWSIGFWYGIIIAIGTAVNLASVIYDTTATGNSGMAQKIAVLKSVLRYFVIAGLLFLLGFLKFGNLYLALVGIMGLKISAYMQPLMGRISHKIIGSNWMYPEDEPIPEGGDVLEENSTLESPSVPEDSLVPESQLIPESQPGPENTAAEQIMNVAEESQ